MSRRCFSPLLMMEDDCADAVFPYIAAITSFYEHAHE